MRKSSVVSEGHRSHQQDPILEKYAEMQEWRSGGFIHPKHQSKKGRPRSGTLPGRICNCASARPHLQSLQTIQKAKKR